MIARFLSFLILLYALGFILFGVTLGRPAEPGMSHRRDRGDYGRQGPHRACDGRSRAGKDETSARCRCRSPGDEKGSGGPLRRQGKLVKCCVDLGSESVDTRSNAEEAQRWLAKHSYKSVRLITNDWHMRRAGYEFRRVLGGKYEIVNDAVRTEPGFATLFGEYNKYLLRRAAVWIDV